MVKTKFTPGVPKWLHEKPTDSKRKLIKDKAYAYLSALALEGQSLQSSTERIPGYIQYLTDFDSDFGKIKPGHMKTTYGFIEELRVQIKNSITKINKEVKDGKLIPYSQEKIQKDEEINELDQDDDPKQADEAE